MTERDVAEAVTLHTGRRVQSIERVEGDRSNVWAIRVGDRTVMLKAAPTLAAARLEAWAYRRAHEEGVPVPRVFGVDTRPGRPPKPYLIIGKVDGVTLDRIRRTPSELRPALMEVGRALRRLHVVRVPGYGPLVEGSNGTVRGYADTWRDACLGGFQSTLAYLLDRRLIDAGVAKAADRFVARTASLFDRQPEARLIHGDLCPHHIVVDASLAFQAIIDFDHAGAGDPAWEFAEYLLWGGAEELECILEGYEPHGPSRNECRAICEAYCMVQTVLAAGALDRRVRQPFLPERWERTLARLNDSTPFG